VAAERPSLRSGIPSTVAVIAPRCVLFVFALVCFFRARLLFLCTVWEGSGVAVTEGLPLRCVTGSVVLAVAVLQKGCLYDV
jgi:hypothetical protein